MFERILNSLAKRCQSRGAVMHITGTSPDDVYMVRYFILPRNRFFNVYIHIFLRSDRDDLHDHPWNFWTWIARGDYIEERLLGLPSLSSTLKTESMYRSAEKNAFIKRKATDMHRVILKKRYSLEELDSAPMTLCVTGPVKREWGFLKDGIWTYWKTYLGLAEDADDR